MKGLRARTKYGKEIQEVQDVLKNAETKGFRGRMKQVKNIPEVQEVLKGWHFDIEKAKRRKKRMLQCSGGGMNGAQL